MSAQAEDPARVPLLLDSARGLLRAGRADQAAGLFRRLVRTDSTNGTYLLGLADAEIKDGHPSPAIDALRQAIALGFGNRPTRAYQVAALFARLRQRDSALAWLNTSLVAGYEQRPEIADDSAFAPLAKDSTFERLALEAPDARALSRDQGWRNDLGILATEAKRLSTGPELVARSPRFDSAVAALSERIPRITDEEIYAGMQRLMAMLGNGHSVLFPLSTPHLKLNMLPVDLYWFNDGPYIVGGVGQASTLSGSRVEAINGVPSDVALQRIAPLINRDNPMGLIWNGPYFLTYPALLNAVGVTGPADSVRLSLRGANGALHDVTLAAGDFRPPDKLRAPAGLSKKPLWLTHPDANYWMAPLPSSHAIYAQYNQVRDDSLWSIAQFADSLLATARRTGATRLILDVRRNNGGSGPLNLPLVRALIRFEGWSGHRQIYVLMGRNTFSAAQNFINQVETLTDAIFVGEPSSSRPNFVGEDTDLLLPYSGIRGSMASRYFQDSDPTDERVWIPPSIPVSLSGSQFFRGDDPVLAAALAHIGRKR